MLLCPHSSAAVKSPHITPACSQLASGGQLEWREKELCTNQIKMESSLEQQPLLLRIIRSPKTDNYFDLHHLPLSKAVSTLSTSELLRQINVLDDYRRTCDNLYARVRCLLFLYAVHRFYLPLRRGSTKQHNEQKQQKEHIICPKGYAALLDRRFEDAIDHFLAFVKEDPDSISDFHDGEMLMPKKTSLISDLTFDPSRNMATVKRTSAVGTESSRYHESIFFSNGLGEESIEQLKLPLPAEAASSSLAEAYRLLAFQTLADQVKSSVRNHPGNEWMFKVKGVKSQLLRFKEDLLGDQRMMLLEKTPVRMDLSHSW